MRPIVSFYTSPTFNLSKYLVRLLSPLVGNTSSAIRSSKDFASFIQQERLSRNEILVSFDAVSLFTRIPVGLALDVVRKRLEEEEESLSSRTSLNIDDIISLLALCLNATYFVFRDVIDQQIFVEYSP